MESTKRENVRLKAELSRKRSIEKDIKFNAKTATETEDLIAQSRDQEPKTKHSRMDTVDHSDGSVDESSLEALQEHSKSKHVKAATKAASKTSLRHHNAKNANGHVNRMESKLAVDQVVASLSPSRQDEETFECAEDTESEDLDKFFFVNSGENTAKRSDANAHGHAKEFANSESYKKYERDTDLETEAH